MLPMDHKRNKSNGFYATIQKEGDILRKSHTLPICMALFVLFLSCSIILYYFTSTVNFFYGIPFIICVALLFVAQNQMHVQIGRAAPRHPLYWHLSVILGCDAIWCVLFLVRYMAELVPNQIKLGLRLHLTTFSLIHLVVFAKYWITARLMAQKAARNQAQLSKSVEGR